MSSQTPRRRHARRYVSQTTEDIVRHCYPGMVPSRIIERAVREMAIREGRLTPDGQPRPHTPRRTP
ncbi:hypothetical protein [Streptomyces sp. TRM68367]|uniref:hypothetical protein n=1 Tax=Streptomyces sp. TRM68367 TaxID=2758415 RepID=UPI00165B1D79|nr:hypothetical protein [Streptomyces sp. TRM68367]MBC9731222.1 hypothetical protein [Streptomyces sp. TRM68367]